MASPPTPPRWLYPAVLVLAALAYVTALDGAFVYDDTRQLVDNPLIQDNQFIGEALASDVWAFKAEGGDPGSNYWRPTFVAWNILNHRIFGLHPFGWHVTNILLHVLVTGLAFALGRRLGLNAWLAAAVAVVFAVHPVHAESVAWIAGSPDLLLGAALLGALVLVHDARRKPGWWRWVLALVLGFVAMGAKEVGVVLPVLVAVLLLLDPADEASSWRTRLPGALKAAAPFAGVAVVYLALRQAVLGQFTQDAPWEHGLLEALLTAPALLFFYLRQLVAPFTLGPTYPLRPVGPAEVGMTTFWGPLLVVGLAAAAAVWMARKGRVQAFGLVLFGMLLLPSLNIPAFPPEHLAHDRYLYLPLLGVLLLLVPSVAAWLTGPRRPAPQAARTTALVFGVLAVPLLATTLVYNRVWTTEIGVWERAIETDPTSGFAWTQYGVALQEAGRTPEADRAFARALELRPMPAALVGRADALIEAGRAPEAEPLLRQLLDQQPRNAHAYERLALVYQQQGRLDAAEDILRTGLTRNPERACSFGSNLGVVLYLQGRRRDAREALEAAVTHVDRERSAACWVGFVHLGNLAHEAGDPIGARQQFQRYLDVTASAPAAAEVQTLREQAEAYLAATPVPG